jgi:hypothetical protein
LIKAGKASAANAIRTSKALGLTITYMEKGILYKEKPDGTKEIVKTTAWKKTASKKAVATLRKGMILHAKK